MLLFLLLAKKNGGGWEHASHDVDIKVLATEVKTKDPTFLLNYKLLGKVAFISILLHVHVKFWSVFWFFSHNKQHDND